MKGISGQIGLQPQKGPQGQKQVEDPQGHAPIRTFEDVIPSLRYSPPSNHSCIAVLPYGRIAVAMLSPTA